MESHGGERDGLEREVIEIWQRDEVFGVFCAFHVMIQNQFLAKVPILRSDNGDEYVNQ